MEQANRGDLRVNAVTGAKVLTTQLECLFYNIQWDWIGTLIFEYSSFPFQNIYIYNIEPYVAVIIDIC